jgi:hypothetical protein
VGTRGCGTRVYEQCSSTPSSRTERLCTRILGSVKNKRPSRQQWPQVTHVHDSAAQCRCPYNAWAASRRSWVHGSRARHAPESAMRGWEKAGWGLLQKVNPQKQKWPKRIRVGCGVVRGTWEVATRPSHHCNRHAEARAGEWRVVDTHRRVEGRQSMSFMWVFDDIVLQKRSLPKCL